MPAAAGGGKATIIVVFNQKGGIGKTTTSVNLAVCLAAFGLRTVLLDLDAQSNASTSVGLTAPAATGAYQLLRGEVDLTHACRPTPYLGLRLVAGSDDLSWADVEIAASPDPQFILHHALAAAGEEADVVVVDCPPAFGILSVNASVAADSVILPVVPSPLALDGLHKAWWNLQRVRTHFNRNLESMGILFTMTEDGEVMTRLAAAITASFGERVLPVSVPRDLKAIEAAARDLPLVVLDPDCPAARAYLDLAETVMTRMMARDPAAFTETRRDEIRERLRRWRQPSADAGEPGAPPPVRESPPVEPGPPPADGWDAHPALEDGGFDSADGAGWKIGVALALMALGGVLGFVFGRWLYLG